jgi:hypothetical protein
MKSFKTYEDYRYEESRKFSVDKERKFCSPDDVMETFRIGYSYPFPYFFSLILCASAPLREKPTQKQLPTRIYGIRASAGQLIMELQ